MSIGNLKDYGNKGNNFPWQLKMLEGLQAIYNALTGAATGAVRYPVIITEVGPGAIPNNTYSFTISNVGSASGTVDGQVLPAGTSISFNAELNNTLSSLSYDASGTTFLVTWIS